MKLGRLPTRYDSRTLRLAKYLTPELPPPPKIVDWLSAAAPWPMYANDRIGDCALVSCAHLFKSWTTNAGRPALLSEAAVIEAYSQVSGYDPRTGANDNGAVMLDVLNYWRHRGIADRKITAYVAIDHTDYIEVRQGIHLFGGVYVGAALPISAAAQLAAGLPWRVANGRTAAVNSWGGHAFYVGAYNGNRLEAVTWGRTQSLTRPWWDKYVQEAYAIVSTDMLTAAGLSPLGFRTEALLSDLAQIGR